MSSVIYVRRGAHYIPIWRGSAEHIRYYRRKNMKRPEMLFKPRYRAIRHMKESTIGEYDLVMMARRMGKYLVPTAILAWRLA